MKENNDAAIFTIDPTCYGELRIDGNGTIDALKEQLDTWESIISDPTIIFPHVIVIFTKIDKLTGHILSLFAKDDKLRKYGGESITKDDVIRYLADTFMSVVNTSNYNNRRRFSFWRVSILESSTALAQVALTALQRR